MKMKEDLLRVWIDASLKVSALSPGARSALSSFDSLVPGSSNEREWFAGFAPLLPITEPATPRTNLAADLARLLVAAVIEAEWCSSPSLSLDTALSLCTSSLTEQPPFDVVELASAISEDDDQLIVILDAVLRLHGEISRDSPLHPLRLVLQVLTANAFDEKALVELLLDDESGARGGFPLVRRLYKWARCQRGEVERAAREWRERHLCGGGWREGEEREEEEDEMEEEEGEDQEEASGSGMGEEEEESCSSGSGRDEERREEEEGRPLLIRVVQIVGRLEEERTFLLPANEEPRRLVRPQRLEGAESEGGDAWMQLLQMSQRLSRALQRHAKIRSSNLRKEYRQLAEIVDSFVQEAMGEEKEEKEFVFKRPFDPLRV